MMFTIGNTTGATSVFTVFEGHEIMFHVSTLLPYSAGNEQQVHMYIHYSSFVLQFPYFLSARMYILSYYVCTYKPYVFM